VERAALREAHGAPVVAAAKRAPPVRPSFTGVAGGVIGFGILLALTVLIAGGASDRSRLWSVPLAVFSGVFLAAAIISARPYPSRQRNLRVIVVGSMLAGAAGVYPYGIELLILMAPPISLVAIAAGLVFQGGKTAAS